jgi:D-hexose-6-phosphate mutarotase
MQDLTNLKKRFEIPNLVHIEPGKGGLKKITVTAPEGSGEIYLHGAHVTQFAPAGEKPVIWMSSKSWFDPAKPIRGGVPVCFPWFGPRADDPKAPGHGFARLREWEIESIKKATDDAVTVALRLQSDDATRARWHTDFVMRHVITIGSSLEMKLEIQNKSPEKIRFEEALHTYLTIGDIKQVSIDGLGGVKYTDKVDSAKLKDQADPQVRFTGETDRVYHDTQTTCIVNDPAMKRKIEVSKTGSDATVVWNPWINKSKAMVDFDDEEWPGMVCVETCNVAKNAVELAGGGTHTMMAKVRLI